MTTGGAGYCWGKNSYGQLGDGTNDASNLQVAIAGGHTFTSISVGSLQACGLTKGGRAYCWGSNQYGQLGDGTYTHSNVPVAVASP